MTYLSISLENNILFMYWKPTYNHSMTKNIFFGFLDSIIISNSRSNLVYDKYATSLNINKHIELLLLLLEHMQFPKDK